MPPVAKSGTSAEALAAQDLHLRLEQLAEVVRQDGGGHAHRDALGAEHQHHRHLGGQRLGLLAAAVVARQRAGQRGVEQHLLRERGQAALDVARGGRAVAGHDVAEVALLLDEEAEVEVVQRAALVGQHHQRVADRDVAVRVQLHALADDVRDLGELAVVHRRQGVQDAALDRLAAVAQVGDGAVDHHVAGVFEEVPLHERLERGHRAGPGGEGWSAAGRGLS